MKLIKIVLHQIAIMMLYITVKYCKYIYTIIINCIHIVKLLRHPENRLSDFPQSDLAYATPSLNPTYSDSMLHHDVFVLAGGKPRVWACHLLKIENGAWVK